MISLKDSWQAQRQQRQHEVCQRQQQVQETLDQFQQERLVKAATLRHSLNRFQLELQRDTQDFLTHTANQRQIRAQQVTQQLRDFTQRLQQQTAHLIAMNAADRASMSQQLFCDLAKFHTDLTALVATLRQEMQSRMHQIQGEIQSLRSSTQQMLKAMHEQRIQDQINLLQSLASYVTALQLQVRDYLIEMELIRNVRAHQVQQMLQQEHCRRKADMKDMFQQLSEFRAELRAFCQNLHQTVWGQPLAQGVAPAKQDSTLTNAFPTATILKPTGTLNQKSLSLHTKSAPTPAVFSV